MYTPYYPRGWQTGETGNTPITAAALNNMEEGIQKAHPEGMVITLSAYGWEDNTQTIEVDEIGEDNVVIVTPNPVSHDGYCEAGVYCSAQGEGTLTFKCTDVPKETLAVNLLIMAEG